MGTELKRTGDSRLLAYLLVAGLIGLFVLPRLVLYTFCGRISSRRVWKLLRSGDWAKLANEVLDIFWAEECDEECDEERGNDER